MMDNSIFEIERPIGYANLVWRNIPTTRARYHTSGKFSLAFDIHSRVLDKYAASLLVYRNPIKQIHDIRTLSVYMIIL
jgi:hypothetical protein